MMGASDCRSKAQDALASAATETNPQLRLDWETMAQQWTDLAGRIDAKEAARPKLSDRNSN
jgi:hypothetical protein